jgi:hypothetical protein
MERHGVTAALLLVLCSGCSGVRNGAPFEAPPDARPAGPDAAAASASASAPRALAGVDGCTPVDLAADDGDRLYLLVTDCPKDGGDADRGATMTAPPPTRRDGPPPGSPADSSRPALVPATGLAGAVSHDGDLVAIRSSRAARVAAGTAGSAYVAESSAALQTTTLLTQDGGGTWSVLASPRRESHFVHGSVAAEGRRSLFAALELGSFEEGRLEPPFPVRVWQPPVAAHATEAPSSAFGGAERFALHLEPSSSRAWVVTVASGRTGTLFRSDDGGLTFARARALGEVGLDARIVFGGDRLFVVSPRGAARVLSLPTPDVEASVPAPAGPPMDVVGAVASKDGTLTVVGAEGDAGALRAASLPPGSDRFSPPMVLPLPASPVAMAARPDGGVTFVFGRDRRLWLWRMSL